MNMGKINNQNFAYIPFYKLMKMIRYKARLYGIKVVAPPGTYTSMSSFFDEEPFDWTVKNIKHGGLKKEGFGRIHR